MQLLLKNRLQFLVTPTSTTTDTMALKLFVDIDGGKGARGPGVKKGGQELK